jgi:predicted nucleotide-binding protein
MLKVPRPHAEELLAKHAEQGQALVDRASLVGDISDYENWSADRRNWLTLTAQALGHVFGGSEEVNEFNAAAAVTAGEQRWQAEYARSLESVRAGVEVLSSLGSGVASAQELAPDTELAQAGGLALAQPAMAPVQAIRAAEPAEPADDARRVFIVRGEDVHRHQMIVRLLEQAGPHEIATVHIRPDAKPLIEKLEGRPPGLDYGIVLLTADDIGTPRLDPATEPRFSPRPRQSVVFEMGVLVGALTPARVCVLYEYGVELPSEVGDLLHVRLDVAGDWQSRLLRELRAAGFEYGPGASSRVGDG